MYCTKKVSRLQQSVCQILFTENCLFRYLTSGFKFRERAALGYVQMNLPETSNIIKQFDIDKTKVQH